MVQSPLGVLLVLGLAAFAHAENVSPVEQVITLLEDLKTEVEDEGASEASTYDTFACFCKNTTEVKAAAIKSNQDDIEEFAATLQEQTSISNAKAHEIKELDETIATLDKEMATITAMREKEKTRYEATAADLSKGISSVEGAITELSAASGGSLSQLKVSVKKSLVMADALELSPKHSRAIAALIQDSEQQGEPEYSFQSDDLVATMEDLEKEFKGKKTQLDQIEGQNAQDYTATMNVKTALKSTANGAKDTAETEKATADGSIADNSDDMVLEETELKDNELYLKDLTERCELKAREWDQRSQMRADEAHALTKALRIINNKVSANAAATRGGALIQSPTEPPFKAVETKTNIRDAAEDAELGDVDLSFLQVTNPLHKLRGLAQKSGESRQDKAIASLLAKATKLKSPILSAIAMKVAADPFLKVKKLIQDLIERLVTEAAEEATKKGWCDTEMSKATHTRNSNMDTIMSINTELENLEASKAQLESDIDTLTSEISDLNVALAKQTKLRSEEKAENMETLDKAKEGLEAVKDARGVLDRFYKGAAKGAVSLLQASPVDADAPAVHSGANQGHQESATGIIAMLDVIISDFEHSIKVTTTAEQDAHREFVEFERTTKTSIMTKETGKSQAEIDLKQTDQKITEGMDDLDAHQKMLDDTLMELEDLRPACVDTGMSYEDRVAKRQEEIDALKEALCELDTEGVESDC